MSYPRTARRVARAFVRRQVEPYRTCTRTTLWYTSTVNPREVKRLASGATEAEQEQSLLPRGLSSSHNIAFSKHREFQFR